MTEYRRVWLPGATWFFTVNLAEQRGNLWVERIDVLRTAFRSVRARHAFHAPSGVHEVYGSAVFGNISSVIKPTSTGAWIMSIGTR